MIATLRSRQTPSLVKYMFNEIQPNEMRSDEDETQRSEAKLTIVSQGTHSGNFVCERLS